MTLSRLRFLPLALLAGSLLASTVLAHEGALPQGDTDVTWTSGPCTEPVLMVPTLAENVRGQIPASYPGTDDDFMAHVVTAPGPNQEALATVVFTLNTCRESEVVTTVNGQANAPRIATDVTEILVMVLWDGPSANDFEFYTLASYVNDPTLATAFRSLGLPSQHTPHLVFDIDVDVEQPEPGAVVPFIASVPGVMDVVGSVVRPEAYGPAGFATQHYDGPRGAVWVEHDSPTGGVSSSSASITVAPGPRGAWLADLLGATSVPAGGMLLEKHRGHSHTAILVD